MTRVFIANEPLKKVDATGEYVRFLPMTSAANYGDVVELTAPGNHGSNIAGAMKLIENGLCHPETGWRDGDYLVLVGDQALLAYAASIIGQIISEDADNGTTSILRLLKWDRRQDKYTPLTLRELPESI